MKDSQKLKKKVKKFIRRKAEAPSSSFKSPVASPVEKTQPEVSSPSRPPIHERVKVYFQNLSLPKMPSFTLKRPQVIEKAPPPSSVKKFFITPPSKSDFLLVLIPLFLLVVLFALTIVNTHYLQILAVNKLAKLEDKTPMHPYPFVENKPLIDLSAKAAIVVEADSQVPLFEKNPNLRFPMASTTKIMTALTALEYYKDNSILTVKTSGVEGSQLGLIWGEQYYFQDLLYAMLLPSANDAAVVIASNYPGGVPAFVQKMNEKAAELHLNDTHFSDPTGLDDDGDYTTVVDMARLASYAIKNKELATVTGTKEKIITNISQSRQFDLYNLNQLLGLYGVTGIKTGTTPAAGEVLVTSAVENGHTYIIVVMNSQQRFVDTELLLNFITNNVQFITPQKFVPIQ
jgi:D-alanyl-D-alanine carboxypeptidase